MRFSISLASASLIPNRFYDKGKRQSRLQRTINLRNMLILNFRVPVHRGQHMHSLHGPVFQTDHSGGHIQSCDVRTTLRLGAWSEMRRSGGETLLDSPREQDSHCCSMLTGLSCWKTKFFLTLLLSIHLKLPLQNDVKVYPVSLYNEVIM